MTRGNAAVSQRARRVRDRSALRRKHGLDPDAVRRTLLDAADIAEFKDTQIAALATTQVRAISATNMTALTAVEAAAQA